MDNVTVIELGEAPLDESELLALAGARVVLGRPDDLSRVAHLLPPVTTPRPVHLSPGAVAEAAAAVDGPVAVVVPAGVDLTGGPGAAAGEDGPGRGDRG